MAQLQLAPVAKWRSAAAVVSSPSDSSEELQTIVRAGMFGVHMDGRGPDALVAAGGKSMAAQPVDRMRGARIQLVKKIYTVRHRPRLQLPSPTAHRSNAFISYLRDSTASLHLDHAVGARHPTAPQRSPSRHAPGKQRGLGNTASPHWRAGAHGAASGDRGRFRGRQLQPRGLGEPRPCFRQASPQQITAMSPIACAARASLAS